MSAALLAWMEKKLQHAQRQFGHANDDLTSRKAQWEVEILEAWRVANPSDDTTFVSLHIRPLTMKLRRQYECVRQSQDHHLIEWQLQCLALWTHETHMVTHAIETMASSRPRPR